MMKPGRLLEGPPLPLLLFQPLALGERSLGYLLAGAENTHDDTLIVPNGAIEIVEMRLYQPAAPIEHDREIFHVHRLSAENLVEQRFERVSGLDPVLTQRRTTERPGMLVAQDGNECVIVKCQSASKLTL
jgi:hypothetical protein